MNSHIYSEIEQEICREISIFAYGISDNDSINADRLIKLFDITDVTYEEDVQIINITTLQPGMIIGSGGKTIDALIEWLKNVINPNIKINLIENHTKSYFIKWHKFDEYFRD